MIRPFKPWIVTHSNDTKPRTKVSVRTVPFLWFRMTWLWYRLVWSTRGDREAHIELSGNPVTVRRKGKHVMIYGEVTELLHRGTSHVKRYQLCDTSHRGFSQQPLSYLTVL